MEIRVLVMRTPSIITGSVHVRALSVVGTLESVDASVTVTQCRRPVRGIKLVRFLKPVSSVGDRKSPALHGNRGNRELCSTNPAHGTRHVPVRLDITAKSQIANLQYFSRPQFDGKLHDFTLSVTE